MEKTEEIDLIVNHPKKAINKLAVPIIISNLFMMLNNIIDGVWVSGLGPHPLAAVGFVTPLFLAMVGFANGLGAGANSLIARYIGAEDYHNAENSAIHSMILSVIVSVIATIAMLLILKPLLLIMGAGEVIKETMAYGTIVIGGIFSIFIPSMMAAVFRSEGEIKRASYPLLFTAVINMILDPIFIYVLGMGVVGAAIATVLAGTLPMLLMMYWMFYLRDSFIKVKFSEYKRDLGIYKDILVVGIPASLEQFILSFVSILMNYWLTLLSGTVAVAIYTATWRLVAVGMAPLFGIGMAALTVGGAAYGARNLSNLKTALSYGLKLGLISSTVLCTFLYIFAEPLSFIFSYSANATMLSAGVADCIRILCFFLLFMPFGILAGNLFQAMGKGTISLALTFLRAFLLEVIFAALFAFVFNLADTGIYLGTVCGMGLGAIIGYVYINYYLRKHEDYFIQG